MGCINRHRFPACLIEETKAVHGCASVGSRVIHEQLPNGWRLGAVMHVFDITGSGKTEP